jgi:hypothetical protein
LHPGFVRALPVVVRTLCSVQQRGDSNLPCVIPSMQRCGRAVRRVPSGKPRALQEPGHGTVPAVCLRYRLPAVVPSLPRFHHNCDNNGHQQPHVNRDYNRHSHRNLHTNDNRYDDGDDDCDYHRPPVWVLCCGNSRPLPRSCEQCLRSLSVPVRSNVCGRHGAVFGHDQCGLV